MTVQRMNKDALTNCEHMDTPLHTLPDMVQAGQPAGACTAVAIQHCMRLS